MYVFKQLLAALAIVGLMFGLSAPAQAVDQQVVYLTNIKKGTNASCNQGFDKMFVVSMRVPKGERIKSYGPFTLTLKNGRQLVDDGYQVNRRLLEYYYFPKSRKARVNRDKFESYAFAELSEGATTRTRVQAMCMSRVP